MTGRYRSVLATGLAVLALLGPAVQGAHAAPPTFTPKPDVPVGTSPTSVAVGDFNGDGKADMAVANLDVSNVGPGVVSVLLGVGNGTFTAAPDVSVGTRPEQVVVGDFNADGKADLAVATSIAGAVSVRLGVGDGTFTNAPDIAGLSLPASLAVADFNNDGKADLVVLQTGTNQVSVHLGAGNGTFTAVSPTSGTGANPEHLAVGDLNNDGNADVLIVEAPTGLNAGFVTVFLGNGHGGFSGSSLGVTGPNPFAEIVIADFNGDGKADFAESDKDNVWVELGDGAGGFNQVPGGRSVPVAANTHSLAVGDFNGDGKPDFAVASFQAAVISVRLGVGDGTFTNGADVAMPAGGDSIAVGDFDGDDHPDLAVANFSLNNVSIRMNHDSSAARVPTCKIHATIAGPPKQIVVGGFDLGSGIASFKVTTLVNATVEIQPFAPLGAFAGEVQAVVTKTNPASSAQVAFVVTDGAGNQASCF